MTHTKGITLITVYQNPVVDLVGASDYLGDVNASNQFPNWAPHDASEPESIVELAGRGCYQSWNRPNPATSTMEGYIDHILEVGHGSVLEHVTVTLYIQGVSRSLTHELVRHRHFGFSQLSQRFVDEKNFGIVVPPLLLGNEAAVDELVRQGRQALLAYQDILGRAELAAHDKGLEDFAARKATREVARAVLPNMTETKITVTGNLRAWRHFLQVRGDEAADAEIRRLAVAVVPFLRAIAPATFQDVYVSDGAVVLEHGSV